MDRGDDGGHRIETTIIIHEKENIIDFKLVKLRV